MTNPTSLLMSTDRLDLVAGTIELANAELAGRDGFAALLDCDVPASWPPGEYDRSAIEYLRDKLIAGGPSHAGWLTWYAIVRGERGARGTLIAAGGYFGPPVAGIVEVGYSVVPEAQGSGYAVEMAQALVARAFAHAEVQAVIAHTFDSNPASMRVLQRCGFRPAGPGEHPGSLQFRIDRPAA